MFIQSKYKDYYDYLQGVYGVDNRLVLDRREGDAKPQYHKKEVLFICGKVMEFFYDNDRFYLGDEMAELHDKEATHWSMYKPIYRIPNGIIHSKKWKNTYWNICYPTLQEDVKNIYPKAREHFKKCPIFIWHESREEIGYALPRLASISGIAKMIPPEELWLMLSEWLGQRITESEPDVPIGDDKIRIVNAGFDLKTSFRGKK